MQEQISTTNTTSASHVPLGTRQMEPRFGFEVYKIAVKLFEKHPLQIFLLGMGFLAFVILEKISPMLIGLTAAFLEPVMAIGLLRCFRKLDSTVEKVRMNQLSQLFFDSSRREDYLILGAANLLYAALAIALFYAGGGNFVFELALGILYTAATFFAYPLVEFDRVKAVDAFKQSLQVSKLNWKPAAVYFFATIVFGVMSLCALGVGFFIFFPLVILTRYVAYRIILNK